MAKKKTVKAEAAKAGKGGPLAFLDAVPNLVVKVVEKGLGLARKALSQKVFETCSTWLARLGLFALIVAAVAGLIACLVLIKDSGAWMVLRGLGWVVAVGVVLYVAKRFMGAGEVLISAAPTKLASPAFLDCAALLAVLAGLVALIGGIYMSIAMKDVAQLVTGLAGFVICQVLACIAMNPSLVHVEVEEGASTGDEAIGVLSFPMKAIVKTVPLAFGVGAITGAVLLIIAIFKSFGEPAMVMDRMGMSMNVLDPTSEGMRTTVAAGLLPLAAYLAFLGYYLAIELIRAILAIPRKL